MAPKVNVKFVVDKLLVNASFWCVKCKVCTILRLNKCHSLLKE